MRLTRFARALHPVFDNINWNLILTNTATTYDCAEWASATARGIYELGAEDCVRIITDGHTVLARGVFSEDLNSSTFNRSSSLFFSFRMLKSYTFCR